LPAAADASAATRHNFDKVPARFASRRQVLADRVYHVARVPHLVSDGDSDFKTCDLDLCFLDAGHSAYRFEVYLREVPPDDEVVCRSQGRFP